MLPHLCVTKYPKAHEIWETNDCSLCAFIFGHISLSDFIAVEPLTTSHLIFEELCLCYEKLGTHAQLLMIKKALDYRYDPEAPLCQGAEHILALHNKITKMGPVDFDQLKIIFLINAFGDCFDTMQSSILSAMDSPTFSANTILCHFDQEDSISRTCVAQGSHNPMALLATHWDKPPRICSNCKKEGHLVEYCIQPSGGLAGKTIKEARNTQWAASGRHRIWGGQHSQAGTAASANIATAPVVPSDSSESITINGRTFILTPELPNATSDMQPSVNLVEVSDENIACVMHKDDLFKYSAYLCENESSYVSIDWSMHSSPTDLSEAAPTEPVAFTATQTPMSRLPVAPFILDSRANCHVSPKQSDFKSLCPIPPISMKGFGGSSAQVVGMGSIEICVSSGLKVSLLNALYIPLSTVRLMSVSTLNCSGNYTCHFDSLACWVTNRSGTTLLCGTLSTKRSLYMIDLPSAHIAHTPRSPTVLYSEHKPNIKTWH